MTFTNLGYTEPTPLDPATQNVWGTVINENFTLIDSSVAGFLPLDISGTGDINLTVATGAPDQSRNARFVFSGVLTGNRTIYFPAARTQLFSIFNNTTGAFTVTIACGASPTPLGTTIAAPQGGNCLLNSDGTNISKSVDSVGLGSSSVGGVVGDSRNSSMTTNAASTGTFTADVIVIGTALNGTLYELTSYSQVINLAITGAGGMDTGSPPLSGFVSLYAIYNPTSLAVSILACNVTTSTSTIYSGTHMPSGFLASALIGIMVIAGGKFFTAKLAGRTVSIVPTAVLSGSNVSATISLAACIPPKATSWSGYAGVLAGSSVALAGQAFISADTTGSGRVIIGSSLPAGVSNAFFIPFSGIPIVTSQSARFDFAAAVGGAWFIYANGYTF